MPIAKSNSFIAAVRKTKFIHIGKINKSKSTPFLLSLLFAKIDANGYAIIKHITVVKSANPKLIKSTRILLSLLKNSIKLSKVKETLTPESSIAPLGSTFVNA